MKQLAIWSFLSFVCCVALGIAFAYAPAPLKRIGLTYIVFGIVCGLVIGRLTREFRFSNKKLISIIGAVMTLAGGFQLAWASLAQLRDARRDAFDADPKQRAKLKMMESFAEEIPEMKQLAADEERRLNPSFQDYLQFRFSNFQGVKPPLPSVVWTMEVLVAAGISGWIVSRTPTPPERSVAEARS